MQSAHEEAEERGIKDDAPEPPPPPPPGKRARHLAQSNVKTLQNNRMKPKAEDRSESPND